MATDEEVKPGTKEGSLLLRAFLHLVLSQLASRLFSFVLNLLVARNLEPDDFGRFAVQFHLITTSILFISREGFRRGCVRGGDGSEDASTVIDNRERVLAVAWLCVPVGLVVAGGVCGAVIFWPTLHLSDTYVQAISILGLAAMVEILSEPVYILSQSMLLLQLRAIIESVSNLMRCVVTYFALVRGLGKAGGVVFAYGQLAYALSLFLGYWGYFFLFGQRIGGPRRLRPSMRSVDRALLGLCGVFTIQSVQKLVLQEGEKMILVVFGSLYNQGLYGLVDKLGSVAVRSFFRPLEESAFTIFSKGSPISSGGSSIEQSAVVRKTAQQRRGGLERLLLLLLKAVGFVGLCFVTFGPCYSYVLIRMLYGHRWSNTDAPRLLALYCFYLMVLAINGITEAFQHASENRKQIVMSNVWSIAFSVTYVSLSIVLVKAFGSSGIILANCCSMILRVCHSLFFARNFFRESRTFSLKRAFPERRVIIAFIVAAVATRISHAVNLSDKSGLSDMIFLRASVIHVGVGVLCLGGVAVSSYRFDKAFLSELASMTKGGRRQLQQDDVKKSD